MNSFYKFQTPKRENFHSSNNLYTSLIKYQGDFQYCLYGDTQQKYLSERK